MQSHLTCAVGITPATLSAYRDDLLDPAAMDMLSAHIPSCTACQAHVAAFATLASALQRQRELEPGMRFWRDLVFRIHQKERLFMGASRRSLISGASVILGIVLVVTLFTVVLTNHARSVSKVTATATANPSPSVTPSPVNLATLPLASSVWGIQAVTATVAVPSNFVIQGIAPDGARLYGYRISADKQMYEVGWFDLATHAITIVNNYPYKAPATSKYSVNDPPLCCYTDGRYIVGLDSPFNDDTPLFTIWAYDTQTDAEHRLSDPNLFYLLWVHNGIASYISEPGNIEQIFNIDLATMHSSLALHQPQGAILPPDGVYPFVFYSVFINNQSTIHLLNAQTGQDIDITRYGQAIEGGVLVDGNKLYTDRDPQHPNQDFLLKEADNLVGESGNSIVLTKVPSADLVYFDANDRVVGMTLNKECSLSATNCQSPFYGVIWDRTLHKLLLGSSYVDQGITKEQLFISSHFLAVSDFANHVTVYDTAKLPTA